jgi:site-specific DNA recombinase
MRTAIYIRVSTEEQANEGYSIPAQTERLRAFCQSQSWQIVAEYIEEGISGKDTDRPQLNKLLKNLDNIDIVLVYKLDRLTRSVLDLYSLLQTFEEHNVAFKSATEVYDTSTAMGRLFITLVAALAQWERENLGERVLMGMEQLVLTGCLPGGNVPYGYDGDIKSLTINPVEAETVRNIFQQYIEGKGVRTICKYLNNNSIQSAKGSIWTGKPLVKLLNNPIYIGMIRWNGIMVEGKHEPIIDVNLWERVQKELERRKEIAPRFATGIYPFAGVLICGYCDKNMHVKLNGKYRYYFCNTKGCKQIHIRIDRIEELFLREIKLLDVQALKKPKTKEYAELEKLRKQLSDIERKKKRWYDAYANEAITLNEFKTHTTDLKLVQDKLDMQIDELENKIKLPSDANIKALLDFASLWHVATPEEQKRLVTGLIESITLYLLPEYDIERIGNGIKNQKVKFKHYIEITPTV